MPRPTKLSVKLLSSFSKSNADLDVSLLQGCFLKGPAVACSFAKLSLLDLETL